MIEESETIEILRSAHSEYIMNDFYFDYIKSKLFPKATRSQRLSIDVYDIVKEINRRIEKGEKIN